MKLNREEIFWGMTVGTLATWQIWPWSVMVGAICAVLWALSGAGYPKVLRRLGVPTVIAVASYIAFRDLWVLPTIPLVFGVLSIGYGIPTLGTNAPDEGSWLGRFYMTLFAGEGNEEGKANIATRLTIAVLLAISLYPVWRWHV